MPLPIVPLELLEELLRVLDFRVEGRVLHTSERHECNASVIIGHLFAVDVNASVGLNVAEDRLQTTTDRRMVRPVIGVLGQRFDHQRGDRGI